MGHNRRRDDLRAVMARAADDDAARDEAIAIVEAWNRQLSEPRTPPQFSPSIGAALRASHRWLRLHCPGCRQVYEIDLRRIVRPPEFSITGLTLTCESGCRGQAPKP